MDQFVEQLRQVSPLSDEIVGQLLEEMKEVSFAKGELSIREGERDPVRGPGNHQLRLYGPGFRGA